MIKYLKKIKLFDFVIVLCIFAFVCFLFYKRFTGSLGNASYVYIKSPNGTYVYNLTEDRTVEIAGKLGITTVEIKGGKAKILDSPCPNKTCIAKPAIFENGQWIVCLPNEVFVQIESTSPQESEVIY